MEERKGRKIIMFPLPFQGHLNPMIQLARIFHNLGFSITILHTSFNFPDPSHYPPFTFRTIPHNNEGGEDPLTQPEASSMDLVAFIRLLRQTYEDPFRRSLAGEVGKGDTSSCCLVSDVVWAKHAEFAAEEVGIDRMVLITNSVASFCAFAALPLLRDKDYLPIQDYRLDELVTEVSPLKVKDLPVMETSEPKELYQIASDMVKGANSSSGVIWNTFEDLEKLPLMDFSSKFQVPIFPIGPFHKQSDNLLPTTKNKEDYETTDWLNKQEPQSVVYVSFGSLADIEEKEFLEIAWGLRNSERPFLWVVRPGFVQGTEWLEALPSGFVENMGHKGKIVKWVNQLEVLAHPAVGAFWTHCGWNSTIESICEGVPMICTPCFTDQRVNSRYIVDVWRIGIELERSKMDKREIEKAISSVMVEEGDGIREMCLELKERADVCLDKDGSSFKNLENLVSHILSFNSYAKIT
ncbi:UDP-glycosyltransferase 76F1 [Cardamine amara subsp. amara]|uniref:UDP-glycosyltransferase 76F1 n=1 Tax=Cardamine amara subsp. amara TaxID=228776 RepID=A0ABD1AMZ2_CARAN